MCICVSGSSKGLQFQNQCLHAMSVQDSVGVELSAHTVSHRTRTNSRCQFAEFVEGLRATILDLSVVCRGMHVASSGRAAGIDADRPMCIHPQSCDSNSNSAFM
jgi:hypothetical protein